MAGQEQVVACIGPLSTSLEGIQIFMETVIAAKPWLREPSLLPFEWKDMKLLWKDGSKKLKVAVFWEDGVVKPHPPVTRALQEVVEKLKSNAKFELVDWKPYKHDLAWEIIVSTISPTHHRLSPFEGIYGSVH
jgi:amidase